MSVDLKEQAVQRNNENSKGTYAVCQKGKKDYIM